MDKLPATEVPNDALQNLIDHTIDQWDFNKCPATASGSPPLEAAKAGAKYVFQQLIDDRDGFHFGIYGSGDAFPFTLCVEIFEDTILSVPLSVVIDDTKADWSDDQIIGVAAQLRELSKELLDHLRFRVDIQNRLAIKETLAKRLGREPSSNEVHEEVQRILRGGAPNG